MTTRKNQHNHAADMPSHPKRKTKEEAHTLQSVGSASSATPLRRPPPRLKSGVAGAAAPALAELRSHVPGLKVILSRMPFSSERETLPLRHRAYYVARIVEFLAHHEDTILSSLATGSSFAVEPAQMESWRAQVQLMREVLAGWNATGLIAFEFAIPRIGKRIDVLVVTGGVVFVLEFKVGESDFTADAVNQVWDYALDMKNFHSSSHSANVVPVLVATKALDTRVRSGLEIDCDGVARPLRVNASSLATVMRMAMAGCVAPAIGLEEWARGHYRPTPTIVEAAIALYGGHKVEDISRREAEAINLTQTSRAIETIIREARTRRQKAICFVTGVPGAGKTLVGLNIATQNIDKSNEAYSVFLSGNGPLVAILREALSRDKVERLKQSMHAPKIGAVRREVQTLIQNVHHFRDDCIGNESKPPLEHVAIFDEAQRAWNLSQTVSFMSRKKGHKDFNSSEPRFLISCMDRHVDWGVIVCLVGGGQEINTGEAGIGEWLRSLRDDFAHWHVHLSPHLADSEYEAGSAIKLIEGRPNVHRGEHLHLSVSMRSFRAEHVSGWVKAVLDVDREGACKAWASIMNRYPIVLTRDVATAKRWLRGRARGNERFGFVVSSQAQRLKPEAIDVRVDIDPVHWFLHPREDVRSSYYLEDAATEFHIQGLELDWAGLVWDGDFRFSLAGWEHWNFRGNKWQRIRKLDRQMFLKNAYRVLLTRARQGMIIVIPNGDTADPTRHPSIYDPTYEYLRRLGVPNATSS